MRERSLKEDVADASNWRHARNRHVGAVIETEFHQYCPRLFTRDRATVSMEGLYRGSSVFLICNGPSFAGLDHSLLNKPGVMTFGMNNGPKTFRPNFWTCVDDPVRFLKSIWLDPKILKFVPHAHFEKPIFDNEKWVMMNRKVGECPNVLGYCRNEKFNAERFITENSINWGCHQQYGGCRSVMLPALRILHLLGFRKIYLLGCDMKMSQQYAYHFDEKRDPGAVGCNNNTYDRLMGEYLPSLKPVFEADGCYIYNCNPDSELKVFPFVSFEDAIKESTSMLGDVIRERVWGMYSKPDEKGKWKEEPPEDQKVHLKTLEAIKQHQTLSPDVFKLPEKKQKPPKPQLPQPNQPTQLQPIITHVDPNTPNMPRVDSNGNPLPNIPIPPQNIIIPPPIPHIPIQPNQPPRPPIIKPPMPSNPNDDISTCQ